MLLGILWNLYDRECSWSLTILGASLIALWVCRRVLDSIFLGTYVRIAAVVYIVVLIVAAFLTNKADKNGGKLGNLQVLTAGADPMPIYAACGLSVVALAIALFSSTIAYYAMWLRRYMVDENNKDYVKLARAKGVNESKITMRHVFRNAFVPMIQYIPTSLMYTVCGSIYIESLYSIPGMGGLLVDVISRQDNPMVQAIVMIYSCIGIVGLILGDLLMVLVDPRISLHGKGDAR